MRDRSGQGDRTVEPFANFLHQRKGRERAGMSASARGNGDQPVGAFLNGLVREAVIDDIVHHNAAPSMRRFEDFRTCAERGDQHGHLPLGANLHVFFQPVVRFVDDLVHGIGRRRSVGIVPVMRCQFLGDTVQPFVQHARRPCVQRGKTADDTGFALRDHKFRTRYDEQGRADDGQTKAVERDRDGHSRFLQ